MATGLTKSVTSVSVGELSEGQRRRAMQCHRRLRPYLEYDVPLTRVAREAGLPLRTLQRWVSRYQRFGLAGLSRAGRADHCKPRCISDELRHLAEGLALQRPTLGSGAIHREVCRAARADRPSLRKALDYVRNGDVPVVWKLDRLGVRWHI